MNSTCHPETKELLIKIFAQSNPIYTINQIQSNSYCSQSLYDYLFPPFVFNSIKLFTYSNNIHSVCDPLNIKHNINHERVLHVFPIVQEILQEGFMVPINISSSDDWKISDAFGTFGISSEKDIYKSFNIFLELIEEKWQGINPGQTLPLRWRKAFSLNLQGSLHFNAIGGESLQVPLVVAVLRSFAQQQRNLSNNGELPFGNAPVFSTGTLNISTGEFGPIRGLEIKLKAFVREYGKGLTALLSTEQIKQLKEGASHLLNWVNVIRADNLTELMTVKALNNGLLKFCAPPKQTEIDDLLELMFKMGRSFRFKEMKKIIKWLRLNISSPVYAFQLERNLGQVEAHNGQFVKAFNYLNHAMKIMSQNSIYFGISEKIDLATAWGTAAVDACDENVAWPLLNDLEASVDNAKSSERAKYWGTLCQIFRMNEDYDAAITAGKKSILFADLAMASEAGRDRNYLIHALIARARNTPEESEADLIYAQQLLSESLDQWAPVKNEKVHFGFCLHFEAELARLQHQSFILPKKPHWSGGWGHPWIFALLSCVRNTKNSWDKRLSYASEMVSYLEGRTSASSPSLFDLFYHILSMYEKSMYGKPVQENISGIKKWCDIFAEKGFCGWRNKLVPFLNEIEDTYEPMASVDNLCDHFHYF